MEVGLGVLFSDSFSFNFSWTLTRVDSINTLPISALWGELSKFSWGAMICWCTFCATSVFVSGQSTLLKISCTLANASIGRPSFSSKPGKSIAAIEVAESISEKRTFIQTQNIKLSLVIVNFKKWKITRYLCSEVLGKLILCIP
jgi:hypothetical protein